MRNNILVVLLCLATLTSCAFLESVFGPVADVAKDPEVQRAAGGVIENLVSGNYLGALYNLGELLLVGVGAVKTTDVVRDRRRAKRGEPTGKKSSPEVKP